MLALGRTACFFCAGLSTMLLHMFVRLCVFFFLFLPDFDQTLVTHLRVVPGGFFFLFHPEAELRFWQNLLAGVSNA